MKRGDTMEWILAIDHTTLFWIQAHMVTPWLTPFMLALSAAGNAGILWILIGGVLICTKKYRRTGIAMGLALLFTLLIGDIVLKHAVMRLRPCIDFPDVTLALARPAATSYSFPSGHTFASFAAAAALYRSLPRHWNILLWLTAAAIGFSRLYLFMHYPSDVAAGALLGLACGTLAWKIAERLPLPKQQPHLSTPSWHEQSDKV